MHLWYTMNPLQALARELGSSAMLAASPIVLVIDDDVSVCESLELLIRSEGWEAELLVSGQEFLTRPRALVPSCLVLDVSLPGLNDLDLQKRVAAEPTFNRFRPRFLAQLQL
jgi:CheY-like chemotaxis protein